MLIEELIEIKINQDNQELIGQAKINSQDVTGPNALPNLRLDVPQDQDPNLDRQGPEINLNNIVIPLNNPGISAITFKTADQADFGEQAGGGQDVYQVGGRRRNEDISFIFGNKMAPRYLAATNLFKPSWWSVSRLWGPGNLERINDILSGRATDETEISDLIDEQELDSLEMPITPSVDSKLEAMSNEPTTFQTIRDFILISSAPTVATGYALSILFPIVKARFSGGSKEKSKNIMGGAKPIIVEGEWSISIVDDTHITLCNQDKTKCYPILLEEGEIEKVKAFLNNSEDQIKSLISSEESILKNEKFSFHPLLSIYLILESYCTELGVTSIEDSWDYEIFIQFFVIANKMINNLLKIYSGEKNTNINKLKACMVGYGLREIIFTSPQYVKRNLTSSYSLSLGIYDYNSLSKMFSIFVNRVCGSVNQTPEDIEVGTQYITNPIFKEYADGIPFETILNSDISQVNMYELAVKAQTLFLEVGNKIISDTNGTENNTLLELTSIELPYLIETPVELEQQGPSLEEGIPESKEDDNVAKGILEPELSKYELLKQEREKTRLENQEREKARQMEYLRNNPITMKTGQNITNNTQLQNLQPQVGVRGGNENTKKNKAYKKTKITRGKARKYKNRTKKHRSIKHRINKKLNKRSKRKI
jgi:hypothetical protein